MRPASGGVERQVMTVEERKCSYLKNRVSPISPKEWDLTLLTFFPESSKEAFILRKSAALLEKKGILLRCFYGKGFPEEAEKGERVLAFVENVEETGQVAWKASQLHLSGAAVYGDAKTGVHLKEGNVITTFRDGTYRSDYFFTADLAFPLWEGQGEINPEEEQEERSLLLLYTGFMIYALKDRDSLLSAMDEGRKLWNRSHME